MRRILLAAILVFLSSVRSNALTVKDLPPVEQKIADTVDPWGLAFADQYTRFQSYFEKSPADAFVVGYTHNLDKIFPNKYWFRGEIIGSASGTTVKPLWTARNSTVSFQIAVLPKPGLEQGKYTVEVEAPITPMVYREEFVKVGYAPYPAPHSEYWPDPLVKENTCEITGLNCAVFLVELTIPFGYKKRTLTCTVRVVDREKKQTVSFAVPVRIVPLDIDTGKFPVVAWFSQSNLNETQLRGMYRLALANHVQPLDQTYLSVLWKRGAKYFDEHVKFLNDGGQRLYQIAEPDTALFRHLKDTGQISSFMIYSNADEPAEKTFREKNIPYAEKIRKQFPGLKIFLASEYFPRMEQGCDIWLTDLSSSRYDPRTFVVPKKPELWHYYCHLPINFQMRAPLTYAPNMMIDNRALEHRLALWMSWYYGAKGVFYFSGNSGWSAFKRNSPGQTPELCENPAPFPYGGIHDGNGFLVYPPKEKDGEALPSLRLKIMRDAVEDIALFEAVKAKYGKRAGKIITLVPDVFVHPHYYDNLPETLLNKREAILLRINR